MCLNTVYYIKTIDAKVLSRMFLAGAKNLEAKKEWINELNVFPVPDGDTGTNMTMTIMSAAAEVSALTEPDMETLAKAISSGSWRRPETFWKVLWHLWSLCSPQVPPLIINRWRVRPPHRC